ncbi:SIMPL domain-containing protein [Thalassotalea ganghwensis]
MFYKIWPVIALSLVISSSNANEQGIEVNGKASIAAVPDQFSITLQIKQRSKSAIKAKQVVDSKSQQLAKLLKDIGIGPKSIDSANIMMYPVYEKPSIVIDKVTPHTNTQQGRVRSELAADASDNNSIVLSYFDVTRHFTIRFNDLDLYDRLLDAATKLGVTNISSLNMSYQDTEKLYQQALEKALINAKTKASQIAKQMDVGLGSLISLRESGYHQPQVYAARAEAMGSFNSNVGEKEITAQVIAKFAIK